MSPAGPETEPPNPPLPAPRKFPFHFVGSGNQTSAMIEESAVGVSVTATRQKSTGATRERRVNTTEESLGTETAEVILPSVPESLARSSHVARAVQANDISSNTSAAVMTGP